MLHTFTTTVTLVSSVTNVTSQLCREAHHWTDFNEIRYGASRDVNKARGVKDKAKANKPRPRPETHKAKANNANVNCRKNATVNLSILSHFRYSLEKLQ